MKKWETIDSFQVDSNKKKAEEFIESDDYILLKNFAQSNYNRDLDPEGFKKLFLLIKSKGYKVTENWLINIYTYELYQNKMNALKQRINYRNDMSINEIIESYVENIPVIVDDVVLDIQLALNAKNQLANKFTVIEDGGYIIIRPIFNFNRDEWKFYKNFWASDGFNGEYIRERGTVGYWKLPVTTRVKIQYGEENYDLFKMLFDDRGISYNEEDAAIKLIRYLKTLELKKFEDKLLSNNYRTMDISEIDALNGIEFESFLKDLFTKMGFRVENIQSSHDQGADLLLSRPGEKIAVQAKRYSSKVTNQAIQEVVASLQYYKADKGWVVTTNSFTQSAKDLAKANNIELINRYRLEKYLKEYF